MPRKTYRVRLAGEERDGLKTLTKKGRASARKRTHAQILLLCDEGREDGGWTDADMAETLDIGTATVARVRRRCVEAEARLVAVACGDPPEGRAKWTLRLLADRLVELDVVPSVSTETVRRTLKKTISSRG